MFPCLSVAFCFLLVCSGSLVTQWQSTGSGQWYSPILRGGMTYSGGFITVPKDGLYYIYAQLHYNPQSGQTWCGFRIHWNNQAVDYAYEQNQSPNGNQRGSRYTGLWDNKENVTHIRRRPIHRAITTAVTCQGKPSRRSHSQETPRLLLAKLCLRSDGSSQTEP